MERFVIEDCLAESQAPDFAADIIKGLSHSPRFLPPLYFYDETGSYLFEAICTLPEYYITRTEQAILQNHAQAMVAQNGPLQAMVEFGSGSSLKTRLLIEALIHRQGEVHYVPVDISSTMLEESALKLLQSFSRLRITAIAGEYRAGIRRVQLHGWSPKLLVFLGSNIGNFEPLQAAEFLRRIRAIMEPHDLLLIGTDMAKDPAILEAAYNDLQGVTAAFNKNVLRRINSELGGTFRLDRFEHVAWFNRDESRIEMHLRSLQAQRVYVRAIDRSFAFEEGETIHTENSYKFTEAMLEDLFRAADLVPVRRWQDARGYFTLTLLRPAS